ncbi:MAG: dicarboxylate/amino acid:cation symporter [Myxococcota bacterium]|nr:dicarboxylate/amino acid:cation symporter [Myxococcota bacterium]
MRAAASSAWNWWRGLPVTTKILAGMGAGVLAGLAAGSRAEALRPIGLVFIRLIGMVILPLVFASLALGIASLGDARSVGRIGVKTLALYVLTTVAAIVVGLGLANVVRPGEWIDPGARERLLESVESPIDPERIAELSERTDLGCLIVESVPRNVFESMAKGEMVPVIVFALFFGVAIAAIGRERGGRVADLLSSINDAAVWMVGAVMRLAPLGVAALMASVVGPIGLSVLRSLAVYAAVVLAGFLVHVLLIYSGLAWSLGRIGPVAFFRAVRPAMLVGFSTSSSAVTLPTTMSCSRERLGVAPEVGSFTLPLGATINMDGTALYQAVAALFVAQVYGVSLGPGEQATLVLTTTLASIGTAAVPGAGVVMLAMILGSVGLPAEGVGLILGVDRLLDMCRTAVNVTGDLAVTVVIARSEGKLRPPGDPA